jgi:hypothetical protein
MFGLVRGSSSSFCGIRVQSLGAIYQRMGRPDDAIGDPACTVETSRSDQGRLGGGAGFHLLVARSAIVARSAMKTPKIGWQELPVARASPIASPTSGVGINLGLEAHPPRERIEADARLGH